MLPGEKWSAGQAGQIFAPLTHLSPESLTLFPSNPLLAQVTLPTSSLQDIASQGTTTGIAAAMAAASAALPPTVELESIAPVEATIPQRDVVQLSAEDTVGATISAEPAAETEIVPEEEGEEGDVSVAPSSVGSPASKSKSKPKKKKNKAKK